MNSGTGSVTYFFLATLDTEKLATFHTDSQGSWLSIRTGLERVGEVAVDVPEWTDMGRYSLSRQQRHRDVHRRTRPPTSGIALLAAASGRDGTCCLKSCLYSRPLGDQIATNEAPSLRTSGLLSSLNVADDHCNEFFFFFENFETFLSDHDVPPLAQEHAKPNSCFLGREDSHRRRNTVLDVRGRQLVRMRPYSYLVNVPAAA